MIRLLLLGLFFYIGYRLFFALPRLLFGRPPAPPPHKSRAGEEMVRDPQCGTFLPRSDALSATVAGERHFFCSAACRDAFTKRR